MKSCHMKLLLPREGLRNTLLGEHANAEVIFAYLNEEPIGFALFFHNYSTFLGKPWDLFKRFVYKTRNSRTQDQTELIELYEKTVC